MPPLCPLYTASGGVRWPHEYDHRAEQQQWANEFAWHDARGKGCSHTKVKKMTTFDIHTLNYAYAKFAQQVPCGYDKVHQMPIYDVCSGPQKERRKENFLAVFECATP